MNVDINWLAVLLAGLSNMVVGMIWYSKSVFGTMWMKWVGLDEKKAAKGSAKAIAIAVVASILTAFVLAHVSALSKAFFGVTPLEASLTTAFWLWLGISATTVVIHDSFEQRPMKLTLLTISNQLVMLLVMGLIIGLLGGF